MRYNVVVKRRFQDIRVFKVIKRMNDRSNKLSRAVMKFLEKKMNEEKKV
jgi:hypothetical protein